MSFRLDVSLWDAITNWLTAGDKFQQIDEIHEAHGTQSRLISFQLRLTELVELLAEAQDYGIASSGQQAKYESLKHRLARGYLDLRPFLLAYIRFDLEDERVGLRTIGAGTDAFEALWVAPNLQSFVDSDDVFFRDRVARANDAVRDYTEHLHCLLETRV